MTELFHLADRQAWEAAQSTGRYEISTRGRTLQEVGFIHCSLRHQVRPVAEARYADAEDLVLLVIDGDRVGVPLRYEGSAPDAEQFPHLYGPLPTAAVVRAVPVTRDAEGRFELPVDEPAP